MQSKLMFSTIIISALLIALGTASKVSSITRTTIITTLRG